MINVEITESDIIRAIRNIMYNPVQIAISNILKVHPADVDINHDRIFVWSDDEDHKTYILNDSEHLNHFLQEWDCYAESQLVHRDADFLEEGFIFQMSEKKFQSFA
jgi:hypothetical protein